MRDAIGMLDRVRDRDSTAAGYPKKGETIDPGRVDNRFEVADPGVEAHIVHVALRHAVAALVVADKPMMQ